MASTNILKYPARFQFGQVGVPASLARVACTDTCIQMILHYYKDRLHSLNDIRRDSGRPMYGVGLTIESALRTLSKNGVTHYRWSVAPYDRAFMGAKLALGPVIVSVNYRYYPTWPGTKCGGNDARVGGKTDCGFNGAHAVLVIDRIRVEDKAGKFVRYDYLVRDPDHNSVKPAYDRITEYQLKKAMNYIRYISGWRYPYYIYPTKKKVL